MDLREHCRTSSECALRDEDRHIAEQNMTGFDKAQTRRSQEEARALDAQNAKAAVEKRDQALAKRDAEEAIRKKEQDDESKARDDKRKKAEADRLEQLKLLDFGGRERLLTQCYIEGNRCTNLALDLVDTAPQSEKPRLANLSEKLLTYSWKTAPPRTEWLFCCDGERSEKCSCGVESLAGCCASHGGACGCGREAP